MPLPVSEVIGVNQVNFFVEMNSKRAVVRNDCIVAKS